MENHVALAAEQSRESHSSTAIQMALEAQQRLRVKRIREIVACDLLLARLYRHHPQHAIAALKGVEPIVIDLEPPEEPAPEVDAEAVIQYDTHKRFPKVNLIVEKAAEYFQISLNDIRSARRDAGIVYARQIAMFLAKDMTLRSLPFIGECLGGKDHTTVLHAVRKIEKMMPLRPELAQDITILRRRISAAIA